jgi:hypothetical protein
MVDASYYAAFAWALLENIVDIHMHPPRIKPLREVVHITAHSTEAVRIFEY